MEDTKQGLGSCGNCAEDIKSRVYEMLRVGSPRLAYAAASGVPLNPWKLPLVATFDTKVQTDVPNVAPVKVEQDAICDYITYQIQNQNTPTSNFSSFAENEFSKQSGIQVRLKIVGQPKYSVVDDFMAISEIKGPTGGWLISKTQGPAMDFHSTIVLPFAPITVTVVFHCRTAYWPKLVEITPDQCIEKLMALGYDCGPYASLYSA